LVTAAVLVAGCAGGGDGKCVYTRGTSDGYEYRCLNVGSDDECKKEHPESGRYKEGECCNSDETKVDNPDDCSHG
jgi:hypothetical protein